MEKFQSVVMWIVLILIILLICFSIYGAFIGSDKARILFNSSPLIAFWLILVFMLTVGFLNFPGLSKTPSLLLVHLGSILIITAGMYSSQAGHHVRNTIFGTDKIHRGRMLIHQNQESNTVVLENHDKIKLLPFSLKLEDFRIEYYEPAHMVRDFISSLAVVANGKTVVQKKVEVNHPLHFGGYYFYQHSYDPQKTRYTILSVVSDSGLSVVYAGFFLLGIGIFWHFWLRHFFGEKRRSNAH